MVTETWVTRCIHLRMRDMGNGGIYGDIILFMLLLLHRKPCFYLDILFSP